MSRSRKKFPRVILGNSTSPAQQFFKRRARVKVRRTGNKDLPNGNYYRRLDDNWSWPSDGKGVMGYGPKAYRK